MNNIGDRLKDARRRAGLTLDQVENRTGIGRSSLSDFENGKREPRISQLKLLADAYHRPFSFFLGDRPVPREAVLWRLKPEDGSDEIQARFLRLCYQYSHLEILLDKRIRAQLPSPTGNSRSYSYQQAESLAKSVRDALQLGDQPGNSLQRVLEEVYGTKIFHKSFLPDGTALSSKSDSFGLAVLLNPESKRWRRNFDLAHELFHLLTWDVFEYGLDDTSAEASEWEEKLATCFARNLLMPAGALKKAIEAHITGGEVPLASLLQIARLFDVSVDALIWQIHMVYGWGKDREERTQALIDRIKKRESQIEEKRKDTRPDEWPERYESLAVEALKKGLISIGKFAEYMEISRYEAMKYISSEDTPDEERIAVAPA
jgi:transcriptional regulator with XRE-family HTH domain/predicted HTH domain antitoxin